MGKKIEISIESCDELIQELKEEWEKLTKSSKGIQKSIELVGHRLAYPFRKSTSSANRENQILVLLAAISSLADLLKSVLTGRIS